MSKLINLTGKRFGKWTVIERAESVRGGQAKWLCNCSCGNKGVVASAKLRGGDSKSCGCLKNELLSKRVTTHGLGGSHLYSVYRGMVRRCTEELHRSYKNYGGRGVSVCDEWLNDVDGLQNFVKWARNEGEILGLQLDREDNDGNYDPSNCRFITARENSLNRRVLNNTSGYVGVYWNRVDKRWISQIKIKGKTVYLGRSINKKDSLGGEK
jgi:hypothetical protein